MMAMLNVVRFVILYPLFLVKDFDARPSLAKLVISASILLLPFTIAIPAGILESNREVFPAALFSLLQIAVIVLAISYLYCSVVGAVLLLHTVGAHLSGKNSPDRDRWKSAVLRFSERWRGQ